MKYYRLQQKVCVGEQKRYYGICNSRKWWFYWRERIMV